MFYYALSAVHFPLISNNFFHLFITWIGTQNNRLDSAISFIPLKINHILLLVKFICSI